MRLMFIPAVLILATTACSPGQPAEQLPPSTHTIFGGVNFPPGAFALPADPVEDGPCTPNAPWDKLKGGEPVTVRDPNGTLVGRGTLEAPKLLGAGNPPQAECRATFKLGVPDSTSFTIDFAGIATDTVSVDEISLDGQSDYLYFYVPE